MPSFDTLLIRNRLTCLAAHTWLAALTWLAAHTGIFMMATIDRSWARNQQKLISIAFDIEFALFVALVQNVLH